MDVKTAIHERRSIQKYLPKPIAFDDLMTIIEAGMAAPTAGNLQTWKFISVVEQDKRQSIAEASLDQLWMAQAPVHIIVVSETEKMSQMYGLRGERLYAIQECAAAVQNIMLQAFELGIGSCWVGAFDEDIIKRLCSIPADVRPQAIITLGYPDEHPAQKPKFPQSQMFYFEHWRGKIKDIHRIFHEHSVDIERGIKAGIDGVKSIINNVKKK